jgi:hypothetical protein
MTVFIPSFQARWQIETLKTSATNEYTGDPWIRQQCLTMADWKTQYSMSLHWAFTTMTTVGYGDILPATNMDRSEKLSRTLCCFLRV